MALIDTKTAFFSNCSALTQLLLERMSQSIFRTLAKAEVNGQVQQRINAGPITRTQYPPVYSS